MICHHCGAVMDKCEYRIYKCPECNCTIFIPYYVDIEELEEKHIKKRIRKTKRK